MMEATNITCITEHSTIGLLSFKTILYAFTFSKHCNHNNEYSHIILSDVRHNLLYFVCWYFWVLNITLYRDGCVNYYLIYCIKNNTRMDRYMSINRIAVTPITSRNPFYVRSAAKVVDYLQNSTIDVLESLCWPCYGYTWWPTDRAHYTQNNRETT